jgi:ankyrin repeat protein
LSHPSFLTWSQANSAASSAQTRILYIKGHPGTGKSTLLSFLYHFHLQQPIQYKLILLSFFFHENGDWLQKCPTGMFRSLLVQLYKQSLSARRTILTAYNEKKEDNVERTVVWTVDEMQSLFLRIVSSEEMRESEVVILIDALDEAVDEEGAKAATSLRKYFQKLTDAVRGRTKIVISCREYPVVVVGGDGLHISIQDENRRDIERFVSYHFQIGVEDWEIQDERVRMDLEKAIVDTADGIFLWVVKRMERIVEELNDGSSSFADVQRLVETESNELFKMYEGILQREVKESAREKAALFLQWVCLAERPLSLTEIRIAMACNERFIKEGQERIEESNDFVESDARMQRLTRSLSGGLAEVKHCAEGSTVQLIHQTVNEFLREGGLKSLLSDMGGPKSSCLSDSEALGRCENTLSRTCFGYLRLGEIAKFSMTYGIAPVPKAHEVEEKFPFIRYAVMFCFLHARRAESLGISQSDLPVLVDQPIGTVTFKISHGDEIPISDRPPSIFEIWKVMFEASRGLYEDHLVPWMHLIHKAADCNLLSAVRYLVEERGQIEVRDRFGGTPLHHAVQGGHEYLVRWLLDSGADLESEDCRLGTPLELAVVKRHDHIIKLLLERGAETNKPSHQFSNTLEAACNANGPMELVEHLIDSGAEVNRKEGTVGRSERTALEAAAHAGNEEVVRLLIAKGAKVNAVSEHHGSALQAAVQGRHSNVKAIVELLLQKGADINARGGTYCNALQSAANFSSPDVIELLLDNGADVNAQGGYYGNALQAACDNVPWNEEVVQLLLSRGADVNAPLGHYGSPLQAAAASGSATVFRMLWDKGARADIKGGCHQNMIEAAGFGGNREIVQHLLDSGADINERGGNLYGSALQAAVLCGSESFVEFLLDKGADVNLQGGSFGNALCVAVETRGKMIEILLKRGADVHAAAPGNLSALQSAVKIGNAKHMKALREHGNEINA